MEEAWSQAATSGQQSGRIVWSDLICPRECMQATQHMPTRHLRVDYNHDELISFTELHTTTRFIVV